MEQYPSYQKATVCFGGDVTATGRTASCLGVRNDTLWQDTKVLIDSHDYAICNLECPLLSGGSPIEKVGPNLKGDPALASFIREWGFSGASLSNNHIMDFGTLGLNSTLDHCEAAGLQTFGAGPNLAHAAEPLRLTIKGQRFAFIAAAEEEFCIATKDTAGVPPLLAIPLYERTRAERLISDVVIVVFHGGNEFYPLPRPGLRQLCRFLVDAGADAVVGHHSHVTGGYEVHQGKPIFYSLGNLLFDSAKPTPTGWNDSILLSLEFIEGKNPSFEIHPCTQSRENPGVALKNQEDAAQILRQMDTLRHLLEDKDGHEFEQHWHEFCADRHSAVGPFLNLSGNRVARKIVHTLLRYAPVPNRYWILSALNRIRCESHRERFLTWAEHEIGLLEKK